MLATTLVQIDATKYAQHVQREMGDVCKASLHVVSSSSAVALKCGLQRYMTKTS